MTTYTIKFGDTLSKIAGQFKTTVAELARTNGIADVNVIQAGKTIDVGENFSNFDTFSSTTKTDKTSQPAKADKASGSTSASLKSQVSKIDFSAFKSLDYESLLEDGAFDSADERSTKLNKIKSREQKRKQEYQKILNLTASNGIKYGDAYKTMDEIAKKYSNTVKKTGDFTISVDLRPMEERMTAADKAKYEAAQKAIEEIEAADSRIARAYSVGKMDEMVHFDLMNIK